MLHILLADATAYNMIVGVEAGTLLRQQAGRSYGSSQSVQQLMATTSRFFEPIRRGGVGLLMFGVVKLESIS